MAADLGLVADAAQRHAHELAVERARDRLADGRLARSRRADEREDRARALVLGDAALLAELAHGQVLDDALLHVVEARVVGVEHLARVRGIEPLLRADAPRHGEQPVEVRPDHRRLAGGVAHPFQPVELALSLLADVVGHVGRRDLVAVLLDHRALVLTELLADRVHLLAEEVVALLLLRAGLDVLANAPPNLELGEPLALEPHGELEPFDDVDGLEQLHLLLEGEVGGVAGGVGERTGLAHRAHEGGDALVGAAQLEDLLDDGAVLDLELARLRRGRRLVRVLLDLDAQPAARFRLGRTEDASVQTGYGYGLGAARQADTVDDLCHGADRRVRGLVLRDEHDALVVTDVGREGDVHAREDDCVLERYEQELAHSDPFSVVATKSVPTTSLARQCRCRTASRRSAS